MTERSLKNSISILESLNQVRNDRSFTHDNPVLNHNESMLVFKNISAIIGFISIIDPIEKHETSAGGDSGKRMERYPLIIFYTLVTYSKGFSLKDPDKEGGGGGNLRPAVVAGRFLTRGTGMFPESVLTHILYPAFFTIFPTA